MNNRVIIAARLSKLQKNGQQGQGIETQDERSREFCDRSGLEVVEVVADTKSGTVAPWNRPNLKPWVTDPAKMALYDGIVAFKNDRLSRGAWEDEVQIRQWAMAQGKTLMIVDGPQWPPRPSTGDKMTWEFMADQARREWEEGRERSMREQAKIRANGFFCGRPPFGFTTEGEKYHRILVPTPLGRKYVPEMFGRCIRGESHAAIALWLTAEGVPTNSRIAEEWSAKTVGQILRNPTYMGHHQDATGRTIHECEAIVDADVFRRAGESIDRRPKRGPVNEATRAMLSGVLKCLLCGGPMYRKACGQPTELFYRCDGKGPVRRSTCRNMIRCDTLDRLVAARVEQMTQHIMRQQLIPGHDYAAELADIDFQLRGLAAQGLDEDAEDAERARLRTERKRLAALPPVPDRVNWIDTGESYASRWLGLADNKRAGWLRSMKKTVYAFNGSEDRLVAAIGTRGCPIGPEDDSLPPEVGGVWVYTGTWWGH